MTAAIIPSRLHVRFAEFFWLAATFWLVRGYLWPTYNSVEVPTLLAMLDPRLFQHDFVVQDFLHFSPRFAYNLLIYLPAHAGIPLAWVSAGWQLVALGVTLTGLRALARNLGIGAVGAAVFAVWSLQVAAGQLGGASLYLAGPSPSFWAGAVAIWGGAFAAQQRWRPAYWCFGGAVLLQFLVGFYAGLLVFPALWAARGWRALPLDMAGWVLGLAAVFLPLALNRVTGTSGLTNAVFVELYAQLRHPHHIVPSFWGWAAWMQAVTFYAGAGACVVRLGVPASASARTLLRSALVVTAILLAINYLGVEVRPVALIAKLQSARATPLAQLAMLAALAGVLQARFTQRDYLGTAVLAVAPLSPYPGVLLLLSAVLLAGVGAGWTWRHGALALATLLTFYQPSGMPAGLVWFYATCAIAGVALMVPAWLSQRPGSMVLVSGLGLAGALACAEWSTKPSWPRWLAGSFAINADPYDIPGVLGQRFSRYAPLDAVVLIPPDNDVWEFKLYARRAIVVDMKNFPFSDRGIVEWHRRISDIVGAPFVRGLDLDAAWAAQPPDRLAAVAARYGARYILSCDRWHPQFPGRRIDHFRDWSMWELPTPR